MKKYMTILMPDGSTWGFPTEIIARSRAEEYADEFGGDVERSLAEDTLPLFERAPWEIKEWAAGNMEIEEFDDKQVQLEPAPHMTVSDFRNGLMNGKKGFSDGEPDE